MKWQVGITTVPERATTLLPATLASLEVAGWPRTEVRLFVDGGSLDVGIPASCRADRAGCVASWMLSALELYLREPHADAYMIVQDDVEFAAGLREYLETTRKAWPQRGYLNLYNVPQNEKRATTTTRGWYKSNQLGIGALALVFDYDAIITLLSGPCAGHMVRKARGARRHTCVDGGIVTGMRDSGYHEYVHLPGLVRHLGDGQSTIGSDKRTHEIGATRTFTGKCTP